MKKFFSVFMIAVCCMALAMPAQAPDFVIVSPKSLRQRV